ncbi:hypothetical protein HX89_01090 [Dermacoccus nishinomiyaensis]|uniref:Uncharacterized protein n=1 Tax=Dermacoccus nishinomiyaensis TaxID=1274 RepID=A0A075JC16_9MICO|nr:hypothetical protein HX89_01090 [Dermacoccus nishinomiyaensis]
MIASLADRQRQEVLGFDPVGGLELSGLLPNEKALVEGAVMIRTEQDSVVETGRAAMGIVDDVSCLQQRNGREAAVGASIWLVPQEKGTEGALMPTNQTCRHHVATFDIRTLRRGVLRGERTLLGVSEVF